MMKEYNIKQTISEDRQACIKKGLYKGFTINLQFQLL